MKEQKPESDQENPRVAIHRLETELGLKSGFTEALIKEDDWSLVIKLHALIEAAISRLLVKHLGNIGLLEVFSEMELSNKRTGKMAFVKSLNLLDETDRRFVHSLSELRNTLVHNISNTEFSFDTHVAAMTTQDFEKFVNCFDTWPSADAGKPTPDRISLFRQTPKLAVLFSSMMTLAIISERNELVEKMRKVEKDQIAFFKRLLENATSLFESTKKASLAFNDP